MMNNSIKYPIYKDRRNSNSIKWDLSFKNYPYDDLLPLNIADMDFLTDDKIIAQLKDKMSYGIYGYEALPDDFYDVFISWYQKHREVSLCQNDIFLVDGAMDGLYRLLYSFFNQDDAILNFAPVYHRFKEVITNTKRKVYTSNLIFKDTYFYLDYIDIENQIIENHIKAIILCSPSNPIGRLWKYDEIKKLILLCQKYHVYLIADEVHLDIVLNNNVGISVLKVAEELKMSDLIITLHSIAKPYNLSGLAQAMLITKNKDIQNAFKEYQIAHGFREKIYSTLPSYYVYKNDDMWLNAIRRQIYENYLLFKNELKDKLDIIPLEATYLLFVDFSKYINNIKASDFLLEKAHILVNDGSMFGDNYSSWVRINLATSKENIQILINRLKKILV